MSEKIRCRMAPAPTGLLHIGVAHTALFNWLFARHHGGVFILRIDDSDPVRSKGEFAENIMEGLRWLGIDWDEGPDVGGPNGPYRQSERRSIYRPYIEKLFKEDAVYWCYCTPEELETERKRQQEKGEMPRYLGRCSHLTARQREEFERQGRKPAIRFRNPGGGVEFEDMVRGEIKVDMSQFGDFLIVRSDGSPLLNFAVIIDDIEMKITHVIRGEDFLNATPYQILMYRALGVDPPKIANLSFVYGPDHTKLSKRHGATGITEYRDMGYLPEAMINFMALLGWSPGDDREIFSKEQLIAEFDFDKVQKGAPVFNINKLNWFNGYYIRQKTDQELAKLLKPFAPEEATEGQLVKVAPLIKERIEKLADFKTLCEFFWTRPELSTVLFSDSDAKLHLSEAISNLSNLSSWTKDSINVALQSIPGRNGWKTGDFFMTLRISIAGSKVTPPLSESLVILGKRAILLRLKAALLLFEG